MKKKYLTRKKAIELCIELWEWLAKTGKRKEDWPDWEKYEKYFRTFIFSASNDCWFCEYDNQQVQQQHKCDIGICKYCPFFQHIGHCNSNKKSNFSLWDRAKLPKTRKKYATLFLEQIKSIPIRKRK